MLNKIIKYISILMFSVIFFCLIIIDTRVEYNYKNIVKFDNFICILIICFLIIIFTLLGILFKKICAAKSIEFSKITSFIESKSKWIIAFLFIVLFAIQIFILQKIYFKTSWDVEHFFTAVDNFIDTGIFENNNYYTKYPYFSVFPNNLFLASVFAIIGKIVTFFNYTKTYKVLVLLGIVLVDLSGIVMIKTIGNLTNKKSLQLLGGIIFIIFIGLSPWFLVPYSDAYSILFPISVLYCYTKKNKKWYHYLLMGICSYLGYLIKPTSIIILIAIVIVELYQTIFKMKDKEKIKALIKNVLILSLGIIFVFLINIGVKNIIKYEADNEYKISPFHYLMMGINQETTGAFNSGDTTLSLSVQKYDERIELNKKIFWEKFNSLSPKEFVQFYVKKMLVNYNDGTLAWGREGGFYKYVVQKDNNWSNKLENFYFNDGSKFYIFTDIMQVVWIAILLFVLIAAIFKKFDNKYAVIYLALIGLTLFTLLFEARARYLYLYMPYYIILATIGIEMYYKNYEKTIYMNKKEKQSE